jgi:NTE family protein
MDPLVLDRLINWGYAVCDAAIRKHVDPAAPRPDGFPYPKAGIG